MTRRLFASLGLALALTLSAASTTNAGTVYSYGEFQTIGNHTPPDRIDIYYAGWRPFTYIWADCANRGGTSWQQSWFPGYSEWFCMGIDY